MKRGNDVSNIFKICAATVLCVLTIIMIVLIGKERPVTEVYITTELILFFVFGFAYNDSKDKFWLIMLACTIPMLISDLYFLPSFSFIFPRTNAQGDAGIGMNMWAGIHLTVISVGCFFYFKKNIVNFANLTALAIATVTNISLSTGLLARSRISYITTLLLQIVLSGYLIYYGIKTKRILVSIGSIIWVLSLFAIAVYAIRVGSDVTPFTLALSDKSITISHAFVGLGALQNSRAMPSGLRK